MVDRFHQAYRDRYGTAPTWNAKALGQAKSLLKQHPLDLVLARIDTLFSPSAPAWIVKSGIDFGTLVLHFDKLAAVANDERSKARGIDPAVQALLDAEEVA